MPSEGANGAVASSGSSAAKSKLTPEQAAHFFERNAFLIVNDLPRGSHVTVDAVESYVTDSRFQGFKLIPPGWHMFAWSGASDKSELHSVETATGLGLRTALFRRFEERQVIVRRHHAASDRWLHPDAKPGTVSASSRIPPEPPELLPASTLTSTDHLRSLDPQLAPYPLGRLPEFVGATRHLQLAPPGAAEDLLAAMLGVDAQSGDVWTDALAEVELVDEDGSVAPGRPAARGGATKDKAREAEQELDRVLTKGREIRYFGKAGKEREDPVAADGSAAGETASAHAAVPTFADEAVQRIRLPRLDARRSWPSGATGAELTRWSIDKSWLLSDLARRAAVLYGRTGSTAHDWQALHIVFELVFLLWYGVQNSACLSYWSELVSCFCQAPALCGAPGDFDLHPALAAPSSTHHTDSPQSVAANPSAIASFVGTLTAQLRILPADFFSSPDHAIDGMQDAILGALHALRRNVARGLAKSAAEQTRQQKEETQEVPDDEPEQAFDVAARPFCKGPTFAPRAKSKGPRLGVASSTRRADAASTVPRDTVSSQDRITAAAQTSASRPTRVTPATRGEASAFEQLLRAWRALSHLVRDRFGIELDGLDEEEEIAQGHAETALDELETGEDAPVVVDM